MADRHPERIVVEPLKPYSTNRVVRNHSGIIVFEQVTVGYRQRRPYTVSTSMESGKGYSSGLYDAFILGIDSGSFPSDLRSEVTNRAYEKAIGELGDGSSFGATLTAERKETFATVVDLITRAGLAAKAVRSGKFPQAARILGIPYREETVSRRYYTRRRNGSRKRTITARKTYLRLPDGRRVLKTTASGWLLWSYGVKPLAQDIYNGMDFLQRPLPDRDIVKVRATGNRVLRYSSDNGKELDSATVSLSVGYSFRATVRNPNLWAANKLGLINPAQWVLEAIPFSFVVDWFSNLSAVVNSLTDFAGLEITDQWVTTLVKRSRSYHNSNWDPPANHTGSSVHYTRRQGSLTPTLRFAYERFNWQRGANAISLLMGFLPKR